MAQKTSAVIKSYFVTGAFPTQSQFEDFVDSKQQTLKSTSGNITFSQQSDGTVDVNLKYKTWIGTESQYNAIGSKDANTIYYITD